MIKKLLCTFVQYEQVQDTVDAIFNKFELPSEKIFLFTMNDSDELICSYNAVIENQHYLPYTISVHRKKETNTLYTINSLNQLIKSLNQGIIDKSYQIDWNDYKDSILLISNGDLNIKKLELNKIFKKTT